MSSITKTEEKSIVSEKELILKIDGQCYNITAWQKYHPGGAEILHHLNGKDATDAFYSIHSPEAIKRLEKFKSTPAKKIVNPTREQVRNEEIKQSFRKLRNELWNNGWWKRNYLWDMFYISTLLIGFTLSSYLSYVGYTLLPMFILGLTMQQAGWLGHDYVHGRGKFCWWSGRLIGGLANGFSSIWWSDKHNTHHVYPNCKDIDLDVNNQPVFYLWLPNLADDHWARKYQHLYFVPISALLYFSWKWQSFKYSLKHGIKFELLLQFIHYSYLFTFPWYVSLGSIYFGGLFVGMVVTASHQSEEMITDEQILTNYNYIEAQFLSTRNAKNTNPLMQWFWGGMDFQLEHHLFPTMPKYRLAPVSKIVQQYAKANAIEYKVDGMIDILKLNLDTLQKLSTKNVKNE